MKQWFGIFSAVLAAGIVILLIQRSEEAEKRKLSEWERQASERIVRLAELRAAGPDYHRNLNSAIATSRQILESAPKGASTSRLALEIKLSLPEPGQEYPGWPEINLPPLKGVSSNAR